MSQLNSYEKEKKTPLFIASFLALVTTVYFEELHLKEYKIVIQLETKLTKNEHKQVEKCWNNDNAIEKKRINII